MSSVIISGDTSGSVTLQTVATAGNTVVTLPIASMNIGNGGGNSATNTAFGAANPLGNNTTGLDNSAFGRGALLNNTTGNQNSAFAEYALINNTTGAANSGFGYQALQANTTGSNNTAVGGGALINNTTASNNTAVGFQSANSNTTGTGITSLGFQAGAANSTGSYNTFIGAYAGDAVTTGINNLIVGYDAGGALTTGSGNTFVGRGSYVAAGQAMTTGSNNSILGGYTGNQGNLDIRTSSNYIVLSDGDGNPRGYYDNNGWMYNLKGNSPIGVTCHQFIGGNANSYEMIIANNNATPLSEYILDVRFTATTPNNTNARFLACTDPTNEKAAILSTGGFLSRNNSYGTYSDVKLKENIVDATPKLDKLNQLQVRNFNFKDDDLTQIGFIAQEFEQVFPGLVEESQDRGPNGEILETTTKSIKTSVLVPMLVKAIQELNAKVIELEAKLESK
jgi:trimeric autotransporter adhesin